MKLRHYILAVFIFLVGVFFSLQGFRFYRQQALYHAQLEFNHLADLRLFLIEQRIKNTMRELSSLPPLFLASSQTFKKNFPLFATHVFQLHSHLLALGWIEKEEKNDSPSVGLSFVDLSIPSFPLMQFFPFQLLNLQDPDHPLLISNQDYSVFVGTLDKSVHSDNINLSQKIDFFQKKRKIGFFLFQPVFISEDNKKETSSKTLLGILVGLADFERIIGDVRALSEPIGMNITIEDLTNFTPQLIYRAPALVITDQAPLSPHERYLQEQGTQSKIFSLDHHTWKLTASPTVNFIKQHQNPWSYWAVIVLGTIGSGLAASYFLIFINHHLLTEQEVQIRTNELAMINRTLQENENRLVLAIQEAKTANLIRNEFLATISHEVRTPLNAIIGFNQCLLMGMDGPITTQQRESLKKIEKSSFYLLSLIDNILDFAKIEAKGIELELKTYNIVEIIHSCAEESRPFALQKNLDFQVAMSHPSIPLLIDKGRIRQVLFNLLGNAVKFTERGFIKVILVEELQEIEIHIIDTGIGLSPEEREKIFLPFSQADSSITRRYGGTGLGLAISKKIIELHKGSISVISEKGKGSTFIVKLPKPENKHE